MGTVRWDLCAYGRNRGLGAGNAFGRLNQSGVHTSSTTASNLTDGAAGAGSAITASTGLVLHIVCDELARVQIGGDTATASSGYLLQPDVARDIEVITPGTVSVIDEI